MTKLAKNYLKWPKNVKKWTKIQIHNFWTAGPISEIFGISERGDQGLSFGPNLDENSDFEDFNLYNI